ncbi:MAG: EAL domain-containing protein [Neptuniibacter sp.]
MKKPSNRSQDSFESLIGLGNHSVRKSYYRELVGKLAELEKERNGYKWLFEHALHGIFQAKLDGAVLTANPAITKICDCSSPEHFCNNIQDISYQLFADSDEYQRFRSQLVKKGKVEGFETRFLQPNGQTVFVVVNALFKKNDQNEPTIEAFVQDISERKRAEHELQIAATAFNSQEGMMITDAEHNILRVNKAFTRVTGYRPEDVIGKKPSILRSGRHDETFYQNIKAHLELEKYWQGEIWNKRKSGEVFPESLIITAVESETGEVTNYVAAFTDITKLKQHEESIHQLAFFDVLTGLPNRRAIQDKLQQSITNAYKTGLLGAVVIIDLDNFKNLNDTQGHSVGDQLLIEVSSRLKRCMEDTDYVARLGGDEFFVLIQPCNNEEKELYQKTKTIVERIRTGLKEVFLLEGCEYHTTSSLGITLFADGDQVSEVMKRADMAMYQAKWGGKNTYRFFDPDEQALLYVQAELDLELRKALRLQQLSLFFQAQCEGERLVGAEVLLRWHHPEKGVISPAQFIPLAEETGLIVPIGTWVLEQACAQLRIWQQDPQTEALQLAVNVSARQFSQLDFVDIVLKVVEQNQINPKRLKLELTESLVLFDIEETVEKMRRLKAGGICFSLDDFGTGYSSLLHLKRLPLDQLKIDRSFVRDVIDDSDDAEIVQTIIAMAKNLGLDVIAEGVETEAQKEFLQACNCYAIQGYLLGRPLPIEDFKQNHLSNL